SVGAQATGTVHNLFVTHKIIDAKKVNVLPKKTVPMKEAAPEPEVPTPASEEALPAPAESEVETSIESVGSVEETPAEDVKIEEAE
ncbi:MAG: hypothetical protein Q8O98_00285, partial [bacterium]|nr:hypothetical protein [bacterium]